MQAKPRHQDNSPERASAVGSVPTCLPYVVRFIQLAAHDIGYFIPQFEHSPQKIVAMNQQNGFFIKLEQSIKTEGIRNPILCVAMRRDHWNGVYVRDLGRSRLWVAKKLGLVVPCIVADYDNLFPNEPILRTVDEIASYFGDKPDRIWLGKYGVSVA